MKERDENEGGGTARSFVANGDPPPPAPIISATSKAHQPLELQDG